MSRGKDPLVESTFHELRRCVEGERFRAFERRCREADPDSPKLKYFELDRFLMEEVGRAIDLDLHHEPLRRVLDLGSGFGYFAFVCGHFAHEVVAVDKGGSSNLYEEACELLGVRRNLWTIERFQPLPMFDGGPFDLVSANHVTFDRSYASDRWGAVEWHFFLDDLDQQMNPGGVVDLRLNLGPRARRQEGVFMPADVRDFFTAKGAEVDRAHVRLVAPGGR